MLRRVKEIAPNSILVAVGCYAQVAKEELEKIPEIDLILGINEKNDIVRYIEKSMESKKMAKINTTNKSFIEEKLKKKIACYRFQM